MNRRTSVYVAVSPDSVPLYVGITCRGDARAYEHSRSSLWWSDCNHLKLIHCPDREIALSVEAALIAYLDPPYNVTVDNSPARLSNGRRWLVDAGLLPDAGLLQEVAA